MDDQLSFGEQIPVTEYSNEATIFVMNSDKIELNYVKDGFLYTDISEDGGKTYTNVLKIPTKDIKA